MVSHLAVEYTDSPLSSSSPPRGMSRCGRLASGWAWDAVRTWRGDGCTTSRPGRCSSTPSARQCSRAPPLESPWSQQNSWDLSGTGGTEERVIQTKTFFSCCILNNLTCQMRFLVMLLQLLAPYRPVACSIWFVNKYISIHSSLNKLPC